MAEQAQFSEPPETSTVMHLRLTSTTPVDRCLGVTPFGSDARAPLHVRFPRGGPGRLITPDLPRSCDVRSRSSSEATSFSSRPLPVSPSDSES